MSRSPYDDDEEELDGLEGLQSRPPKPAIQGPTGRVYSGRFLGLLAVSDEPRRSAIRFIEHPGFEPVILVTIFCNIVTMAWVSPLDPPDTPKAAFISVCEIVYLAIFTVEMLSKMLAYGLAGHEGAYLRDPWCQLDFVIVTLAWAPILVRAALPDAPPLRRAAPRRARIAPCAACGALTAADLPPPLCRCPRSATSPPCAPSAPSAPSARSSACPACRCS
jgi:hypothetical protein